MIGLQYLHNEKIKEVYNDWCMAAIALFDAVKTGNEKFRYKNHAGKIQTFGTLQEKIRAASKEKLKQLLENDKQPGTNQIIAEYLRKKELCYLFSNREMLWGLDVSGVEKEAKRCDDNRKKTYLYYYVYESLKEPFEDVYGIMQKSMQDSVFDKLNVRTCPYCNRLYTFTLVPKKKGDPNTSPEFDHFFPKSIYPTLAICFYNLIPSCHCCNHGKSAKQLRLNPYSNSFSGKFYVSDDIEHIPTGNDVLGVKNKKDIHIIYKGTPKEEEDVRTLGLDQLYNMHVDYVEEIVNKANSYKTALNQDLTEAFQGIYHTGQEVFDFVWGYHLETAELENRPLSKLTKDILEQIGIKR